MPMKDDSLRDEFDEQAEYYGYDKPYRVPLGLRIKRIFTKIFCGPVGPAGVPGMTGAQGPRGEKGDLNEPTNVACDQCGVLRKEAATRYQIKNAPMDEARGIVSLRNLPKIPPVFSIDEINGQDVLSYRCLCCDTVSTFIGFQGILFSQHMMKNTVAGNPR